VYPGWKSKEVVRDAMMQYKCISAGDATASGEIAFKLE
jgi:hypothetical protein